MATILKAENVTEDLQDFTLPVVPSVESLEESVYLEKTADVSKKETINSTSDQKEREGELVQSLEKNSEAFHEGESASDITNEPVNQAELDAIKEDAYNSGYQEALLDVESKYKTLFEQAELFVERLESAIPKHVKDNESVIGAIVLEAVFKIVGNKLLDKDQSLMIVNDIVENLDTNLIEKIYITQSDFDSLSVLEENLNTENKFSTIRNLTSFFEVGDLIGGCKVVLKDGFLDASIDQQISALIESLKNKTKELAQ